MSQMSFNSNSSSSKQSDSGTQSQKQDYSAPNSTSIGSRSGTPNPLLKPGNIFNPYKAMSQYKSDEKVMSLTMSSLQHTLPDRRQENLA